MSLAPAEAASAPVTPLRRSSGPTIAAHLFTVALFAAWWGYSQVVPAYQVPGPGIVLRRMAEFVTSPLLAAQLAISLGHVLAAISIAFGVGAALAFAAHHLPVLRLLIDGRLTPFLNAFSGIGWLFLAILWFGINSTTVIFAVTMVLIPFAIINLRTGLVEMDAELIELGRSLTDRRLRRLVKLGLPMLVPYVFATFRTSFGVSWKVVLTAELFGGNAGIGYLLNAARQEFDTETIFAVILFIVVFVALAELMFFRPVQRLVDRRFRHG